MNENLTMEDLMNSFELKHFRKGDITKGKVVSVNNDEVVVNIGHFADGIIAKSEFSNDKNFDINSVNINDEICVMVLSGDDGEGNIVLSKKRADAIKVWEDIEDSVNEGKLVNIRCVEVVKGGVVCDLNGVRAFMPGSQCAAKRIENLESLIGKVLEVKVIEFNKKDNKVIVSRRVVEEEIQKNEKIALWKTIKSGEKRKGTVTKLVKFGAFVDIGGIQGLVHINDMAWSRVNNPEDIVKVGDSVEVYVQEVDRTKERVSLSLKDVLKNPWETVANNYKAGSVVQGVVSKFIKVGAFIELEPGIEGFVHLSEITDDNITKASDSIAIGQKVKVKVLDINLNEHKMSLSIKDADEKSKEYLQYNDDETGFSLGDLFKNFKF